MSYIQKLDQDWVHDTTRYHKPTDEQIRQMSTVRYAVESLMNAIIANAPDCADRTFALRLVRLAMMQTNAAISLEGKV